MLIINILLIANIWNCKCTHFNKRTQFDNRHFVNRYFVKSKYFNKCKCFNMYVKTTN